MTETSSYVPAAGRFSLAVYDRALALTTREQRFRSDLMRQLLGELPQDGTVIDIGAGTGTFAITLAEARQDARVIAIDGDAEALRLAKGKSGAERVEWREGMAGKLPLEDASAEAVVMSLLLHHLDGGGKMAALGEAHRVLRPGGRLHIADWGPPGDPLMRGAFFVLQLIDGFANTADHASGRLPAYVEAAGFANLVRQQRLRTAFGRLELLSARRS